MPRLSGLWDGGLRLGLELLCFHLGEMPAPRVPGNGRKGGILTADGR
jgi:hypothetical protein